MFLLMEGGKGNQGEEKKNKIKVVFFLGKCERDCFDKRGLKIVI